MCLCLCLHVHEHAQCADCRVTRGGHMRTRMCTRSTPAHGHVRVHDACTRTCTCTLLCTLSRVAACTQVPRHALVYYPKNLLPSFLLNAALQGASAAVFVLLEPGLDYGNAM